MKKLFALICLFSACAFAEGSAWETAPHFSTSESATLESSASEAPAVESSTLAAPVAEETLPTAKQTAPRIANPKEHRGFYSNFGTGFSYVNFHTEQVDGNDYEEANFKGFTFPLMDFRFGVGVANLLVFYTEFNKDLWSFVARDGSRKFNLNENIEYLSERKEDIDFSVCDHTEFFVIPDKIVGFWAKEWFVRSVAGGRELVEKLRKEGYKVWITAARHK